MPIRVVSFDCADTLLKNNWHPVGYPMECIAQFGICPTEDDATSYGVLLVNRRKEYEAIHLVRDPKVALDFWVTFTAEWLSSRGYDPALAQEISDWTFRELPKKFDVFPDVLPTLERLRVEKMPMIVISNWDFTLHDCLAFHSLTPFFEFVIASLEEGVEKPEAGLFQIALSRLDGVQPEEVLHVGDNPGDDLQGATDFGMQALLIDRGGKHNDPRGISSLEEIFHYL